MQKKQLLTIYNKLYEIGKSINETITIEDLYDIACDFATKEFELDKALIFQHDDSNGWFKVVNSRGYNDPMEQRILSIINLLLSGEVIEYLRIKGKPIIHTSEKPKQEVQALVKSLFLEEAYFELLGGDKDVPYSLMIVGNSTQKKSIFDEDALLLALGNFTIQLSNSINNSLFYKAWRNEREKLEENIAKRTKQISEQNKFFEAIYKTSKDGIAVIDIETTAFLDVNPAYCEMTGYTRDELLRTSCIKMSLPDEIQKSQNMIIEVKKNGYVKNFIKHCVGKAGNIITINMSINLMDKTKILVSSKDITKEKQQEALLLKQKEEFQSIFDNSKDGIAITDLESNFLEFNDAYVEMTGYPREELLTKSSVSLTVPEEQKNSIIAFHQLQMEGFIKNLEKTYITKSGKRININMTVTLLPDKKRVLIISKDITNQKVFDEQTKLASMGEMLANIAHQWRQPLSVISTSISGLSLKSDLHIEFQEGEVQEISKAIMDQTQYLSKTIDDFRNYLKGEQNYRNVDLHSVVSEALSLVNASFVNNFIDLSVSINESINIIGSKSELQQALINIFHNAKDALKENNSDDSRFMQITTHKIDNNTLELTILDNGGGIDEKIIPNIFEPYFTTKHQSLGTGLGLSMVEKIIRHRHKQKIEVYNEEVIYKNKKYKGACFKLIFVSNINE